MSITKILEDINHIHNRRKTIYSLSDIIQPHLGHNIMKTDFKSSCSKHMTETTHQSIKICIVGNQGVGKTSLIRKYYDNEFSNAPKSLGRDFVNCHYGPYLVQIWDMPTKYESYEDMIDNSFLAGANGIFIVYSMTDIASINSINDWLRQLKNIYSKVGSGIMPNIIFIGNKIDIFGEDYKHNQPYIGTSALTGANVNHMFEEMIKMYIDHPNEINITL